MVATMLLQTNIFQIQYVLVKIHATDGCYQKMLINTQKNYKTYKFYIFM